MEKNICPHAIRCFPLPTHNQGPYDTSLYFSAYTTQETPSLKSACHEGLTPPHAGVLTTPPPLQATDHLGLVGARTGSREVGFRLGLGYGLAKETVTGK